MICCRGDNRCYRGWGWGIGPDSPSRRTPLPFGGPLANCGDCDVRSKRHPLVRPPPAPLPLAHRHQHLVSGWSRRGQRAYAFAHAGGSYHAMWTGLWFQSGPKHVFEHPWGGQGPLQENTFRAIFDPLLIPKLGHFKGGSLGPNGASKWPQTASKRAQSACPSTPNGPGTLLEKNLKFFHFHSHFRPISGPSGGH